MVVRTRQRAKMGAELSAASLLTWTKVK